MKRIALVDDHHLMRNGLVAMINGLKGYSVCLEAANGREFIDALETNEAPDIAVIDLNMPVMDGYEAIAWTREHRPEILSLALTFDPHDDAMVKAVRAGARGFLRKDARPPLLEKALDSLVLTGYYQTDEVHQHMVENGGLVTRAERERLKAVDQMTAREMEFLMHVCSEKEYTYDQIAELMDVNKRTVENYRVALFDKFGIKSKTGLVLFALRLGLLDDQLPG